MSVALITGITGQDGRHLTKFLLEKGYEIHGIVSGRRDEHDARFQILFPRVTLHHGDLTDSSDLIRIIDAVRPTEIYNLGAISFVGVSFLQPELTSNVTGLGS